MGGERRRWWYTPGTLKTRSQLFCHLDDGAFAKIQVDCLPIVVTKLGLANSNQWRSLATFIIYSSYS